VTRRSCKPAVHRGPIAVRAYVAPTREHRPVPLLKPPEYVLVLDAETTTDRAQALLFGSYRVYRANGRLLQEGLFHADELPAEQLAVLERYVDQNSADGRGHLRLLTRTQFVEWVLWKIGYVARARIVGFNLPFDLSRLALGWCRARNGGFSFDLYDWVAPDGTRRNHMWRPRMTIKAFGSKRQFLSFTTPARLDPENRDGRFGYRGRFLDLHTLAYVLTDRSLTLDGAAGDFGLAARKAVVSGHGEITPEYIDYNRQDVRLTFELHGALLAEWARHPIALAPEQAYSPAAIGKAYLRAMGIRPPAARAHVVNDEVLGHAMVAYYGGRSEVRIRGVPQPVRYVDYTSMYSTVFVLLDLWSWVISDGFAADDWTLEARRFLDSITQEQLHDPSAWPALAGVLCRVQPAGELLPVRARYGFDAATGMGNPAWTIGLNHLTTGRDLWYTLADLVVAKLLGGRAQTVLEAVRVRPVGVAHGLLTVRLRGDVRVDPEREDLFKLVIEARGRIKRDPALPAHERGRLEHFLKVFANATAYGVFAEVRQLDVGGAETAHGLRELHATVAAREEPGEFSFPPLAATIAAASRLLLALLQADVKAAGGSYVACDTDSLMIVATERGMPPEGGSPLATSPPSPRTTPNAGEWHAYPPIGVRAVRLVQSRASPPEGDGVPARPIPSGPHVPAPASLIPQQGGGEFPSRLPAIVPSLAPAVPRKRGKAGMAGTSPHGDAGIRPLSWAQVDRILEGLNALNPYDSNAVPSLVKIERQNYGPDGETPTELYALATSAKRYVLYERGSAAPIVRKPSEHGLGLYRSPLPAGERAAGGWATWIEAVWLRLIRDVEGEPSEPEPDWFDLPAVSQLTITTPALAGPFAALNRGRPFAAQVKPFNFLLQGHVDPLATGPGAHGEVTPVAPYTSDPSAYLELPWVNRHDGRRLRVGVRERAGSVRLMTYRDVVTTFRWHPEHKSGDPAGGPGVRGSVGRLPRLHVFATGVRHIGKESNRLEELEDGLVLEPEDAYVEYRDERVEWEEALPALRAIREARGWRYMAGISGLSERAIRDALNLGRVPHQRARGVMLLAVAQEGYSAPSKKSSSTR
jgi:hypothetical protein